MPMDNVPNSASRRIAPSVSPPPNPPAGASAGGVDDAMETGRAGPSSVAGRAGHASGMRRASTRGDDPVRLAELTERTARREVFDATKDQAKDLGRMLAEAPKFAITPDPKKPLTLTGNTFPQDKYLDKALREYNETHDEISKRLKDREGTDGEPGTQTTKEEFNALRMKLLHKAAEVIRADVAYSFESNSANTRREDAALSVRSPIFKSNVATLVHQRLPLAAIPLMTQAITAMNNGEESDLWNKVGVGLTLAMALPWANEAANHRYSESNGGNATKLNLNVRGMVGEIMPETVKSALSMLPELPPNRLTGPHASGPASFGIGGTAMGLMVALVSIAGFTERSFDEDWGSAKGLQPAAQAAATVVISLVVGTILEVSKQALIARQTDKAGDDSAHLLERQDHRRELETYVSQTKPKSLESRIAGYEYAHTPRGRALMIERVSSAITGVVAGAMTGDPSNMTAPQRTAVTFLTATMVKKFSQLTLQHMYNHPQFEPERGSLATTQIRVDDIRNSAMEGYIDFSAAIANAFTAQLKDNQDGYKSSKDILYSKLLQASNPQAGNASGGQPATSTTQFDIKPFAATSLMFDNVAFSNPDSKEKLTAATTVLQNQLEKFRADFTELRAAHKDMTDETSNHLRRQFDYIEKSTRSCEDMLGRLHKAIEFEFTGASTSEERTGPHGWGLYVTAHKAIKEADASTALGRKAIADNHEHVTSFCCGSLEGPNIEDMDLTKIPNSALGVAAVAVRETLKSEIYELHTRTMVLATNMSIEGYIAQAGLDAGDPSSAGSDNGKIPESLLKSLQTLLPVYTGLTNATFEETTRDFMSDINKIGEDVIKDKKVPKSGKKSMAYHTLSREAGMRPNMTMMADIVSRQLNSDDGTPSREMGERLQTRLELLRSHVDDVHASRSTSTAISNFFKGKQVAQDGIDIQRVKARLDLALNQIKSQTSPQDGPQTSFVEHKHRALWNSLDKIARQTGASAEIVSSFNVGSPGTSAHTVAKDDLKSQLELAFSDMTHDGNHQLSVATFITKLEDKLGSNNSTKLADIKDFISKELPQFRDFFNLAATELNFIAKNAFGAVSDTAESVTIDISGSGGRRESDPTSEQLVLIKQHVATMKESIANADGDVKRFWEGQMATPVPASTRELKLYQVADAHRHQSAFANQHENLVDSYLRMRKVGVTRSVIMPIPTILNNAGRPMDYYTSATGGSGMNYAVSAADEREGQSTSESRGAMLFPNSAGEDALFKQLFDLRKRQDEAKKLLEEKKSEFETFMIESGQLISDAKQKEIDDLKATIQGIQDVFDFYVVSTTVADMANNDKLAVEERVLTQFTNSKEVFGSHIIRMMGENTFNKINVNSRQPVPTTAEAAENAIMIAAQLGRPFNLHSDAAKPGDKQSWFEAVRELLNTVKDNVKALDAEKMDNAGKEKDFPLASNFKVIWSHAGGIAADAREPANHLSRLRKLMTDEKLGEHLLVDISWDKTYSVAMKNFQDHLKVQKTELDDLPKIKDLPQDAKKAAKEQTLANMQKIRDSIETLSMSMDNFSSATTKAHLATRHGLDQTAALSRVAASTPFDLHKEKLINFKGEFAALFKSDENLRAVFTQMIEEEPNSRSNNWMGFFVQHSDKIMFGTDALVPYTKVTGEMQYQMNAFNYYPFYDMIDVMKEYYSDRGNILEDGVNPDMVDKLACATENITHGTFDRLIGESNYEAGDQIADAYAERDKTKDFATSNAAPGLEDIYKTTRIT